MQIAKISIKNYRSLKEVSFSPAQFTLFVGRNNHGKSNVFEAIDWFYSVKGSLEEIRHFASTDKDEIVVEIEFSKAQAGIGNISLVDNRQKIKNIIGESDSIRVRRTSSDPKNRYIYNPTTKNWQKQPTGADSTFNNCIPRFEFILTNKSLKEVSAYKSTTPIGQMLGSVLSEALQQDPRYIEFKLKFDELFQAEDSSVKKLLQQTSDRVKAHLSQQFPDCKAIEFKVDVPPFEEFLKAYSTTLDDGVVTSAESKGDGMQRALMLAIIKAHADARRDDALGKAFIFFIDEAELHLHPSAQRQLKSALIDLTQSVDQVFITTHSSVFLSDEHLRQKSFVVEKEEGVTSVSELTRHGRIRAVYDLLGGSPTDLLLPANFLVVEGPSEVCFLEEVCARHYGDRPAIHIVPANGDDERQAQYLSAMMKMFAPIGDSPIYKKRAVLLLDSPTGEEKTRRLNAFLSDNPILTRYNLAHTLPTLGLEDYYPADLRALHANLNNKVKLAKKIGQAISRESFENDMTIIFDALTVCWECAYGDFQPDAQRADAGVA